MSASAGKRRLKWLLGNYPHTAAIKNGTLASERLDLEFIEYTPVWDGFDEMVRHQAFDVSEMAAVTFLLGMAYDKPMVLLPAAMLGRFQQPYAYYAADRPVLPHDLGGKRVGVRSVTTTTGLWVRGILTNDYGVDPSSVRWVTTEAPHVEECPDNSERAPEGRKLLDMLLAGEIDAVVGEGSTDPRTRTLFDDPAAEAQRWFAKNKALPVNHLVVVSRALLEREPDTVREVYRLLKQGRSQTPTVSPDPIPFGIEGNRAALELLARYAHQLGLIPRAYSADEIFAPVRHLVD